MTNGESNPYLSPKTEATRSWSPEGFTRWYVVVLILLIVVGGFAELLATFLQGTFPIAKNLTLWMMPRFGWIGMFLGVNALFGLFQYLWNKQRRSLFGSVAMLFFVAAINGWTLYKSGTTTHIENPFHDRLPSAWAWSVVSFLLAGAVLGWLAYKHPPSVTANAGNQGDQ